jgi:hypothetical protein
MVLVIICVMLCVCIYVVTEIEQYISALLFYVVLPGNLLSDL